VRDERLRVLAQRETFRVRFGEIVCNVGNDGQIVRQRLDGGSWGIVGNGAVAACDMTSWSAAEGQDKHSNSISPAVLGQQVSNPLALFHDRLTAMSIVSDGRVDLPALDTLSDSDRTWVPLSSYGVQSVVLDVRRFFSAYSASGTCVRQTAY
jgi:hypothetical protein